MLLTIANHRRNRRNRESSRHRDPCSLATAICPRERIRAYYGNFAVLLETISHDGLVIRLQSERRGGQRNYKREHPADLLMCESGLEEASHESVWPPPPISNQKVRFDVAGLLG